MTLDKFLDDIAHPILRVVLGIFLLTLSFHDLLTAKLTEDMTAEQLRDYDMLARVPTDEAISKAANELYKRDDIARVHVTRGSDSERLEFQISLDKQVTGYKLFSTNYTSSGYRMHISYLDRSISTASIIWSLAKPIQSTVSAGVGCFLLVISFVSFLGNGKKEDQTAEAPVSKNQPQLRSIK